jgi:hypothetical protein
VGEEVLTDLLEEWQRMNSALGRILAAPVNRTE